MRRGPILALLGIGTLAGGIAAAVALFLPWLPPVASTQRARMDEVFWFVVVICIVIFAIVVAALVYSVLRFRAAPDDDSDGPPIHGHTGLEIVWTLVPTVLVTAIGIFSAIVLARNDALGSNPLRITERPSPQSSVQITGYVPTLLGVMWSVGWRPGTVSCFCPNSGTQNE